MTDSILNSTKKILGISDDYTVYDLDIITLINAAFSTVSQLGVGPSGGFFINDAAANWSDINLSAEQLAMVKTYVYLKVRFLFDPPSTGYLVEAMDKQIKEYEWRLNVFREIDLDDQMTNYEDWDVLDGGQI